MIRFCLLFLLLATPVLADSAGRIQVIDGDTFQVGDVRVRLFGVDAPEREQTCTNHAGRVWECGAWVTEQVRQLYEGANVTCQRVDTDRYGREVARCTAGGQDIGEAIVLAGLATAYREYSWDYDLAEKAAQVAGLGIWSGSVQAPAEFRAEQVPAPQQAPGTCIIKGNISDSGRIYHMPHNRDYERTRIDEARGERWFCSESEAQAAGWRSARN